MTPAPDDFTGLRRSAAAVAALLGSLVAGCFEIPPEVRYSGEARPHFGAPVYEMDPFAATNRWFHRAFRSAGAGDGAVAAPAEPFAWGEGYGLVDRAELIALLEAVSAADGNASGGCEASLAQWFFHCDVLALLTLLESRSSSGAKAPRLAAELVEALERAAARLPHGALKSMDLTCWSPPPPLRAGTWTEVDAPLPPGLLPTASDLRWTRVLRRATGDPPATVLLRLRVARTGDGRVSLLPLASECWMLAPGSREGLVPAVWRFDRAAWLARREPWQSVGPRERLSLRDPLVADGERLDGPMEVLCRRCHDGRAKERRGELQPSSRSAQLARAEELLARSEPGR